MWTTTDGSRLSVTTRFNPLAGIPCGQRRWRLFGGLNNGFQSPCGDSMWTTAMIGGALWFGGVSIPLRGFHVDNCVLRKSDHGGNGFNPLAGIPCGQLTTTTATTVEVIVSIPLRGFHVDNGDDYSAGSTTFQSPCGDSMWTTTTTTATVEEVVVSIPLRGFHVDNAAEVGADKAMIVSIPLRGFHVDNAEIHRRAAALAGFNPLAGIPCGQPSWMRTKRNRAGFNPLAGIPCGQRVATVRRRRASFQSPCGDSMWTTRRARRGGADRFNPLAGIPCGQQVRKCFHSVGVSIPLRGFHVDNPPPLLPTSMNCQFQSPCGDSMWTTWMGRWTPHKLVSIPLRGFHVDNTMKRLEYCNKMFQSPCGDSMWTTWMNVLHTIIHNSFNPLAGIPCGQLGGGGPAVEAQIVSIPLRGFHVDNSAQGHPRE